MGGAVLLDGTLQCAGNDRLADHFIKVTASVSTR
jgi:hypothetical protein